MIIFTLYTLLRSFPRRIYYHSFLTFFLVHFSAISTLADPEPVLLPGGYFSPPVFIKVPPVRRPTRRRQRVLYYLYAQPGVGPRLNLRTVQVGKYDDKIRLLIKDAAGNIILQKTYSPGSSATIPLEPPAQSGLLTIECRAGHNAVELTAENARLLLPLDPAGLQIISHANPLYIYIDPSQSQFQIELAGQGSGETARALVKDTTGRILADFDTLDTASTTRRIIISPDCLGRFFSITVGKASRGVFEDCTLRLLGAGPFAAENPADLIQPVLQWDGPILVRSEERPAAAVRLRTASLVASRLKNLHFSLRDSTHRLISERALDPHQPFIWQLPDSISSGSYTLHASADLAGHSFDTQHQLFMVSPPANLTSDKTLLINGKPFFARGLYHVQTKDYELVKAQGFNMVQASPSQVPDCERAGLKAAVALYAGMSVNPAHYREMILKYRDNPAVACWMTMDEPALHGVPLDLMAEGYATIRHLAPHPAYTCLCRPQAYPTYGRCTDIIAVDVYPIGRRPLTAISDTLAIAEKDAPSHTVWFIGQVWSWPNTRFVTPREHRCMSYLALTHADVRGLLWYSFRDAGWYLPESNPAVWDMCKQVNQELSRLESVLLTRNLWQRIEKSGHGEIHCAAKKHDNILYIIATNPTDYPTDLNLNLKSDRPDGPTFELFEKRNLILSDHHLTDHFDPLDTRVYTLSLTP